MTQDINQADSPTTEKARRPRRRYKVGDLVTLRGGKAIIKDIFLVYNGTKTKCLLAYQIVVHPFQDFKGFAINRFNKFRLTQDGTQNDKQT